MGFILVILEDKQAPTSLASIIDFLIQTILQDLRKPAIPQGRGLKQESIPSLAEEGGPTSQLLLPSRAPRQSDLRNPSKATRKKLLLIL